MLSWFSLHEIVAIEIAKRNNKIEVFFIKDQLKVEQAI
jgi:hypothetical protein